MAPSILHRALSFSNLPIHRRDILSLQEPSGVSSRYEGLALLTAISEGGGSCSRSPPLANHTQLEKRLVSKILHLREALDLPCQGSCNPLDELLFDTLEALKIAYPKCLSGLSGPCTSSVKQVLVDLDIVLRSVLDCHEEHKQMHSEKHTIAESQSLLEIGEHVIKMLDQVNTNAKEKFSSMESFKGADAAGAAWSENLHESRTLPPVLCRSRSLSHHKHIGDHPSDDAVIAVPMRLMEETKIQEAPRQDAPGSYLFRKDDLAFGCERPPTPADDCLLQTTPSSMSPHPLSAPPRSPVPMMGLPMLLQPWEVMQDGNAAAATSPPPTAQSDQAASTANQDATLAISTDNKSSRAGSVSMEAGQPSSASAVDSHASMQPLVQEVSLAVRNASPPPTPSPSQIAAKAPPPPPPGNILAVLHAKRAASKLKRSTQMGSLYRHLRDRVEGSGCSHAGKRQQGKKAKAPAGTKGDAGQGMADALAEMTKRSAYFRQIEEDAENHASTILELKDDIGSFQSKDMAEVVKFHRHVEQQLVCLTDETQVLARFEGFPSKRLESLRMAAALYSKLDGALSTLKGWKLATPLSQQLDKVEGYFNKIKDDVDMIERSKDEETKRFQSHGIHFDFGVLVRIKGVHGRLVLQLHGASTEGVPRRRLQSPPVPQACRGCCGECFSWPSGWSTILPEARMTGQTG